MTITKKLIESIEDIGEELLCLTREQYYQCNAYSKTSLNYRKKIALDNDFSCSNDIAFFWIVNKKYIIFTRKKKDSL